MFQELVTAGDLMSWLDFKGGNVDQANAIVIVHQILKGVEYLHGSGIVHRDLNLENVLMTSLREGARVVITDFGLARHLPPEGVEPAQKRMKSRLGHSAFSAP